MNCSFNRSENSSDLSENKERGADECMSGYILDFKKYIIEKKCFGCNLSSIMIFFVSTIT